MIENQGNLRTGEICIGIDLFPKLSFVIEVITKNFGERMRKGKTG